MRQTAYQKHAAAADALTIRLHDGKQPPWHRIRSLPGALAGTDHKCGNAFSLAFTELDRDGDGSGGVWDTARRWAGYGHEPAEGALGANVVVWEYHEPAGALWPKLVEVWRHSDVTPQVSEDMSTANPAPASPDRIDDWVRSIEAPVTSVSDGHRTRPCVDLARGKIFIPHRDSALDLSAHYADSFASLVRWAANAWVDTPANRLVAGLGAAVLAVNAGGSPRMSAHNSLDLATIRQAMAGPRALYDYAGKAWNAVQALDDIALANGVEPLDVTRKVRSGPRLALRI